MTSRRAHSRSAGEAKELNEMSDKSWTAFLSPCLWATARKASSVASGPIPWEVVHEDQRLDQVPILEGKLLGDDPAHRQADQDGLLDAELSKHPVDVLNEILEAIPARC